MQMYLVVSPTEHVAVRDVAFGGVHARQSFGTALLS